MLSIPFDAAHQKDLSALIGKVLPDARAQHIAEAVAAGYGYRTHKTLLAAIRAVGAGRSAPVPDFDADRLTGRLHEMGEDMGNQDQALRFLFGVMSDGPRSGPPAEPDAPDEAMARQCLRAGLAFAKAGQWRDASAVLSKAMAAAPASLKGQVVAALEAVAPHSDAAAANLAFALPSPTRMLMPWQFLAPPAPSLPCRLTAYLKNYEPDEADVHFLRPTGRWPASFGTVL